MTTVGMRSCIISCEIVGPYTNGGIGTHCFYLAKFLSRQLEQEVTFVYTGEIEQENEAYWQDWFQRELGIRFVWISPAADHERPSAGLHCQQAVIARRVFDWLRSQTFDVCFFQEMLGHGYRCFQAKRLGIAFQNTVLTCTLHSSWEWICQAMQIFPNFGLDEMQTKYLERYCIEQCDIAISPSEYMFEWARQNRIRLPERHHMLPYLSDFSVERVGCEAARDRIIFFGRLEVRKGFVLFLDALCELERRGTLAGRRLEVTCLGKPGFTLEGGAMATVEKYRARLSANISLTVKPNLGHHDAMEFLLANRDALVVCPSLVDNSPYAVIECLQLGLNIIAAKSGGIPELFADDARLFEPLPAAFADKIEAGLANRLPPPVKFYDADRSSKVWEDFCRQVPRSTASSVAPGASPRVNVIISADGSDGDLAELSSALQAQTFKNFLVTILSEKNSLHCGSAPSEARCKIISLGWSILELGDGIAQAALPAGADYVALLGRECRPKPEWLEQMVGALNASNLDALTCCAEVAVDGAQSPVPPARAHEALGACLEAGIYANMFGLGCVILKAVHAPTAGSELRQSLTLEGLWPFLAQTVLSGKRCDAHPDPLIRVMVNREFMKLGNHNYVAHAATLSCYARAFPPWLGRLVTNAVASEIKLEKANVEIGRLKHELKRDKSPGRTIKKVKRETARIIKQIKDLGGRITGTAL